MPPTEMTHEQALSLVLHRLDELKAGINAILNRLTPAHFDSERLKAMQLALQSHGNRDPVVLAQGILEFLRGESKEPVYTPESNDMRGYIPIQPCSAMYDVGVPCSGPLGHLGPHRRSGELPAGCDVPSCQFFGSPHTGPHLKRAMNDAVTDKRLDR